MSGGPAGDRGRTHRIGLRTRVTAAFAIGSLVLSAALAGLTYQLARGYLARQREQSLLSQTYANARLVKSALRSPAPDIPRLLESVELPAGSNPLLLRNGSWFGASVLSVAQPEQARSPWRRPW